MVAQHIQNESVDGEDTGENILVEEETEESAGIICDKDMVGCRGLGDSRKDTPGEIEATASPFIRFPELRMDS